MGADVYRLEEIACALGLDSPNAARNRVKALRDVLEEKGWLIYLPAEGNALSVRSEGLGLLHKLQEIINTGATMADAAKAIKVDLGLAEPPPDPHRLRKIEVECAQIREEIDEIREEIKGLRRPWWSRMLRLPPPS